MRTCQNCTNHVDNQWTLCQSCRHDYAKTLHTLRRNMLLLQAVARREYKLGDHTNTSSDKAGGSAPTPIILHGYDLLDLIETTLQGAWADSGAIWSDRWQKLTTTMMTHLPQLCQAPHAGYFLRALIRENLRIEPLVDRRPRRRRIIGMCPADGCEAEITAAPGETWRVCEHCGRLVNVAALRADTSEQVDRYHLTRTPAGLAEWLKHEYGYAVSRKQVTDWIRRGKLPSSKPVADGYWEFSVREVLALALAKQS